MFNRKIGTISKKIHTPYEGMFGGGTHIYIKEVTGNGYINLTNAVANKLLELKAYGGTEQRNLPSGYTQLEYIQSSGTQYIDTGVYISTGYKVRVKAYATSIPTTVAFFGCTSTASPIEANKGIFRIIGATINRCAWGSGSGSVVSDLIGNDRINTWYDMVCDNGVWTINDELFATCPEVSFTSEYSMWLFARNTGGEVGLPASCRISVCQIWDENGNLVFDCLPCKNSSNVVGMYDTVNGVFYQNAGTGDFVAGDPVVPTPATPMDIVSNNGVIKVSKNLCDVKADNVVVGKYISAQGVIMDSTSNFIYTKYIPVKPNTTYTLTMSTPLYFVSISEYSSAQDSGFIKRNTYSGGVLQPPFLVDECVLITDANTNYLRFGSNMYNAAITLDDVLAVNWMLVQSSATPYIPYGQIYTDGTVETINVHGKNLFDVATRITGYYISAEGVVTENADSYYSALIPVQPNTYYTYSGRAYGGNKRLHAYDASGNWIQQINYASVPSSSQQADFSTLGQTPANCKYVRISGASADTNVQIEQGSTATTYETYFNGGTATAEMLLKVGDYQDVQSIIDGVVTRKVGVKVLDGTENWQVIPSSNAPLRIDIPEMMNSNTIGLNNIFGICSHFQAVANTTSWVNYDNMVSVTSNSRTVCFRYLSGISNVNIFKQFLADQYAAGTPVIVIYPLATPTTETVTGQSMDIQAGTNTIEITQASIDNLPLYAKYNSTSA